MNDLLIGIDAGTSGAKAALFSFDGRLIASADAEYPLSHPRPGWAEQDPEDWWRGVCAAVNKVLAKAPDAADRILAVGISAQAPTMLALDRDGKPVRPALIWMDRRAEAEAVELRDAVGAEEIVRITGNRADPFYVAAKIRWLRQNEPENFARTAYFEQANGFISRKLASVSGLDPVHGGLLQLRDWQADDWSPELCELCGVTPGQFSPLRPAYELHGEVSRSAAEVTGLRAGTPVAVGVVDGAAAAVEAGAVEAGVAAEMTGTSNVLIMPNDRGLVEPAFIACPHAVPNLHLLLGALATSGASLRWFRDQFGGMEVQEATRTGIDAYELLTRQAAEVAPGCDGVIFLPYMMGERSPLWHSNARGLFFGLSLATTKGTMVRAILEGVAFALRHNAEIAQRAGVGLTEIRSVGGGSRSALWNQIKADVLNLPILVPRTSVGAAFGAAVLAGMGAGVYPDVQAALRQMVQIEARFEPDPQAHAFYNELYSVFRDLYERLRDEFDHMAAIMNRAEG
ncbi:MAG: FGGY-family carbohydrate kinase [Caldilineales bacterium]|nr:FGGY-family carbohydrate kinase [Caldilineales bacterium]